MDFLHLGADDERLCWAFYDEIYQDAFPYSDHTETPLIWLPLMRADSVTDQPRVHIVLAREFDDIRGGVVFEWYRQTGCWLTSYVAVRPNARQSGIATGLMAQVAATMQTHGRFQLLFAEAENPLYSPLAERPQMTQRLQVLAKLGLRHVPIPYVQPVLATSTVISDDLLLLIYRQSVVSATRLRAFLAEFYAARRQQNSPWLTKMNAILAVQQELQTEALA